MKKETLEQLKTQKYFKKADIFAYVFLAILIFALFVFFVFLTPTTTLTNLTIVKQSKSTEVVIFDYNYFDNTYKITDGYDKLILVNKNNDGLLVTILTDDLNGFNEIQITATEAFVKDANCSFHQDCMKFPKIKGNNNVIICIPHGLTLLGVGDVETDNDDPIIG